MTKHQQTLGYETDIHYEEIKFMSRPAKAIIHLDALRHNFHTVRRLTNARILGVVKSNAYGHGVLHIAHTLETEGIDALAVACIEEAIELREGGITCPIVLLEGFFESSELALVEQYNLTTMLQNTEQVAIFLSHKTKAPIDVWIKIDTGMHRLGFHPDNFMHEYLRIKQCSHVGSIVLATHFSCSDEPDNPYTKTQIARFRKVTQGLKEPVSLSNSAAIINDYDTQDDWVRPGLMLTGISPIANISIPLKPVMELTANIIAVKELPVGSPIGYGNTFITTQPTKVGIVAIGYGDGYPQHLPTGTPVQVEGQPSRLLGKVSMDTLGIDLTTLPEARVGTPVTLWGAQPCVRDIAAQAGTIPYALLTGIQRIKREYVG